MDLSRLLAHQEGVVSRGQLVQAGLSPSDLRRLLRRRDLMPVHPGVYVDHTGPLTDGQRLWAGVLACSGVLAGHTAQRVGGVTVPATAVGGVELVIPWSTRCRRDLDGVQIERRRGLEDLVVIGSPPRLRVEDATIDLADRARNELGVVDEITRAVQSRRTTADRLLTTARERRRLHRRDWLVGVLEDVATGACSVLEHGYLTRVERPHGLPVGRRQVRDRVSRGVLYRDVEYDWGVVAELDGRIHHDSARARDRDFDRDLDAAVDGRRTVRLSYGQVYDRGCWTAERMGRLLMSSGWRGRPTTCPLCA